MNRFVGVLAGLGLGPSYIRLLEVRGRRSGKTYSTPVNLLELNGHRYLVGGRGHTAWSKNALAAGVVTLKRGARSEYVRAIPLSDDLKPPILKAYLQEYRNTVQRFFAVPVNSPVEAFAAIADRHPVFELVAD
jgi:deazaflavin-dependent oxidoreductase (nitroreductase family)